MHCRKVGGVFPKDAGERESPYYIRGFNSYLKYLCVKCSHEALLELVGGITPPVVLLVVAAVWCHLAHDPE